METVLVTGANRGIGLELVKEFLRREYDVLATCRSPANADALTDLQRAAGSIGSESGLDVLTLDVADSASISACAQALGGRTIDVLVNNAGVMKREAGIADIDYEHWLQAFSINTLAPMRLAGTLKPNLLTASCPRVATVSSQMGSISRGRAGCVAYRSSKAAVNMAMRSLADEWREDGITVCTLHPGWVRTDMGGSDADLTPEQSAADLVCLIAGLDMAKTGSFLNHDGTVMPW